MLISVSCAPPPCRLSKVRREDQAYCSPGEGDEREAGVARKGDHRRTATIKVRLQAIPSPALVERIRHPPRTRQSRHRHRREGVPCRLAAKDAEKRIIKNSILVGRRRRQQTYDVAKWPGQGSKVGEYCGFEFRVAMLWPVSSDEIDR